MSSSHLKEKNSVRINSNKRRIWEKKSSQAASPKKRCGPDIIKIKTFKILLVKYGK